MSAKDSKPQSGQAASPGIHEASRREKLRRIEDLGFDPWGSRFDDRSYIGDIRARVGEIKFQRESGETIDLPDLDSDIDFRQWLADQGPEQPVEVKR